MILAIIGGLAGFGKACIAPCTVSRRQAARGMNPVNSCARIGPISYRSGADPAAIAVNELLHRAERGVMGFFAVA